MNRNFTPSLGTIFAALRAPSVGLRAHTRNLGGRLCSLFIFVLLVGSVQAQVVTTLAGSTSGYADATGTAAKFSAPEGVVADGAGNLYVAD